MSIELVKPEDREKIAELFAGWEETLIWSCLQGLMGKAWADSIDNPKSAQIIVGDFCYFAGEPNRQLVRNMPKEHTSSCIIMVPGAEDWNAVIEQEWADKCHKTSRFAIKKEGDIFDRDSLRKNIEQLPEGYRLKMIGREEYQAILKEEWAMDFCAHFADYEEYMAHGLGCVVYYGEELAAGASSYTYYDAGIEIELGTKENHRRKGLATIAASMLILECLERGLYPSWDARVWESVVIAQRLGYHFEREYTAYVLSL